MSQMVTENKLPAEVSEFFATIEFLGYECEKWCETERECQRYTEFFFFDFDTTVLKSALY